MSQTVRRCFGLVAVSVSASLPKLSFDLIDIITGYAFEPRLVGSFGKGILQNTLFLAINAADHILVGDSSGICVFDNQGKFLERHKDFVPGGIHCDETGVAWFTNRGLSDVGIWRLDVASTTSQSPRILFSTWCLSRDSWMSGLCLHKQTLFVCDRFQFAVLAYKTDGCELFRIGGVPALGFVYPCDCLVSADGELFVSDWALSTILVFDARDGKFRREFGGHVLDTLRCSDVSLVETSAVRDQKLLLQPAGMTFYNGNILVSDWGNKRVCAFRLDGTFMWSFPLLFNPWGIGVDSQGRISVCSGDSATSPVETYVV